MFNALISHLYNGSSTVEGGNPWSSAGWCQTFPGKIGEEAGMSDRIEERVTGHCAPLER